MFEDEQDDDTSCPGCMGESTCMGALGNKLHFTCRDCGLPWYRDISEMGQLEEAC